MTGELNACNYVWKSSKEKDSQREEDQQKKTDNCQDKTGEWTYEELR